MIPYNNNPQLDHHHHHHQAAAAAAAVAAHQAAAAAAIYPVTAALDIQTGGGHHAKPSPGKQLFVKMPRVVPKQRERFEEEELFKRNVREMEVRYTLFRDRPKHERQAKFHQGCREGHVEVSHTSTGLVLILTWNPLHNGYGERVRHGCDFNKETGKVHIRSSLILNGVCIRWKGWIDAERLDGIGCIEFDSEMAEFEDNVLQQQIRFYSSRLDKSLMRKLSHEDAEEDEEEDLIQTN